MDSMRPSCRSSQSPTRRHTDAVLAVIRIHEAAPVCDREDPFPSAYQGSFKMRMGLTFVTAAAAAALALPVSSASAAKPSLSASVNRLDCGSQAVDAEVKACESITFTNKASNSVQIGSRLIEESGAVDFTVSSSDCTPTAYLGVGASCVISVAFNPAATGRRSAKLVLRENTLLTETSVRLVGFGTA
jgi:hypothetical protein